MKFFQQNHINFIKKSLALIIIVSVYVISHKNWFLSFSPITGGDVGFVYQDYFLNLLSTLAPSWNNFLDFGSNGIITINYFGFNFLGALIAKFGFDYNVIFRGIAFYPLLIGFIISSIASAKIIGKNSWVGLLSFGIIFSLNTFSIVSWTNMMVAYAFLPFIFFTIYKYLQERKLIWLLFFSLFFFISLIYEVRIAFITFLVSFLYIIYSWIYQKKSLRTYSLQLFHLSLSCIIILLLGSFIIFPLVFGKSISTVYQITSQSLFGTDIYTLKYALSFMHPYWTGESFIVFAQQPIKFYFWIYPLFAFSSLFFLRKNKNILFFTLLAFLGIFMGKGASPPFGGIYIWLYSHIPFFNFFREPIEWWAIIAFAYAMLIGYFLEYSYEVISKIFKKKKLFIVSDVIKFLLILPILLLTFSIAYPAYSGVLGNGLNSVQIPDEYKFLKQHLVQDKFFYRILHIPLTQRFVYYNADHPSVSYSNLPTELKSLDTKLLSLEGIKDVILPDDVLNDVYSGQSTKDQYQHYVAKSVSSPGYPALVKEKDFGNIHIFENPVVDVPHISPVKELVYVAGTQNIADIIGISTDRQVAYYTEEPVPSAGQKALSEQINKINMEMHDLATKQYIVAECIRCDLSKKYYDYAKFPYAKILPSNPLYPLITAKEDKQINSTADPAERMKLESYFAEKRVVETQTMINKKVNKAFIVQSIDMNTKLIENVQKLISASNGIQNNEAFLETLDYLLLQQRTYSDLFQTYKEESFKDLMIKQVYRLSDVIADLLKKTFVTDGDNKKLLATLSYSGNYEVLVKNDPEINFRKTALAIDNVQYVSQSSLDGQFISYGVSNFPAGVHQVSMNVVPNNLLATDSASFTISSDAVIAKMELPMSSLLDPQTKYELSFDYKVIAGRGPRIFITDDASDIGADNSIIDTNVEDENDGQWHHYTQFFTPPYGVSKPVLHIWLYKQGEQNNQIEFKNLSVTKMFYPVIVFVKDTGKTLATPKISYQEMNPADYSIHVENAKSPFLLVFSEQFDGGWKTQDNNGWLPQESNIVKNYFGNSIQELSTQNQADINAFIGKRQTYNFLHPQVNGFANAWVIDKKGSYSISFVFSPQKYFLTGFFISSVVLLLLLVCIVLLLIRKYKLHKWSLWKK